MSEVTEPMLEVYKNALPEFEKLLKELDGIYESLENKPSSLPYVERFYEAVEAARDITLEQIAMLNRPAHGTYDTIITEFIRTCEKAEKLGKELEARRSEFDKFMALGFTADGQAKLWENKIGY